jgi:hypothetical protein
MTDFTKVENYLHDSKAIAWDGCHKIYVLMDDYQVMLMNEYEYPHAANTHTMSSGEILATLKDWYEDSCGLRFIQAVKTVPNNPNEGFIDLIPQFADYEEKE